MRSLRGLLGVAMVGALLLGGEAWAAEAEPETVVLLHGLGRSERSMRYLAGELEAAGYRTHAIHYASREKTPEALVADLDAELARCCVGAERVHFVTHSLGGVLVRALLAERPPANLGRVVMLAPPNGGSELADVVRDSAMLRAVLGPTAAQLGTDTASLPNRLPPASFEVGVIAGTRTWSPLRSWLIPAADDGTVSVASTRLAGMADFLTLPVSHTFIVRSEAAARQVLRFLERGRFHREMPVRAPCSF